MKTIHKLIAYIGVGMLSILSLQAQNIIRPKIAGPNGLWVNSYNGVLFFGQTDFETQNSAMPMQLRFYYNSSAQSTDYGYGLGFSLGYEMRYTVNAAGSVIIETGDGRTDLFIKYGKEYEAPAGVFSVLTQPTDSTFLLTEKTGEKYYFDDAKYGKVTAIEDRYGNQTTLTYQDSLLVSIQDAVGHTITLSYTDGLLRKATATFLKGTFTYDYDGMRRLRKRTDAEGNTTLYAYDSQNHINEITDANGHKTLIAYNSAGMVSRMKTDVSDKSIRYDGDKTVFIDYTQPQNQYSYYRWDKQGRVIEKVGLCCGIQSTLEYDEDDNVIKRTDANGAYTTYTYDDRGNMLSLTDALGKTEYYTYETSFNQVASYQDKNGNTYRFTYDAQGNLTSLAGPLGFTNTFTYNEKGWPLTTTDANNNVTATTYNADGTAATIMDAAGNTSAFTYDVCGNLLTATDGRNNTTHYTYDNNNRILTQKDAQGGVTTISYDKVGNVVRVKDAKNRITAYTYDALGQVLTETNAMGGVTTYTYDGKGNILTAIDPLGQKQIMTYNDKNKLLSQTNAANETTTFEYDAKGNLIAVLQPNGNIITYTYGTTDLLEQISDNMGLIAQYTYDANGNQLSVTDGLYRTVTYTYDALNRRISEALPSGSTANYTYDKNSNLLSITDALGHSTKYTYSSLNQQLTHLDALNAKTQFEYDANGNLIKATDAKGNTTVWTYDVLNRNTDITFADGRSLQYHYDILGNIIESKDRAGNASHYVYDALGRLLSKTYADGTTDTYTYDAIGQMLSATNKDATVAFSYDKAGRLLNETLNSKTTSYAYDVAAGKRVMIYPSGMKVEELLNARDLITTILQNGKEAVSMTYNVAGQKDSQTYANGITTQYTYNTTGWLEQIADEKAILNFKMSYDAIGNITKREDLNDATQTENYAYDAILQLVGFTRGETVNTQYTFDLLGNRIKILENNVATNYTTNNVNAYTAISGKLSFTPQYDDNGNLLNDDKHTYTYDLNSKLIAVDGTVGTYAYDALGRRISKTTAQGTTHYYYVGDQMVEEYVSDMLHASYLYGNNIDEVLQMKQGNSIYYYHTNHLGSTMALTDSVGKQQERVVYDVYGAPTFINNAGQEIAKSSVNNTILFTGREYDYESNIYYFRARSQHPQIGRFMQHDPLMYVDGMNDLNYVNNNIVNFIDPWGCIQSIGGSNLFGSGGDGNYFSQNSQRQKKNAENLIKNNKAKKTAINSIFKTTSKRLPGAAQTEALLVLSVAGIAAWAITSQYPDVSTFEDNFKGIIGGYLESEYGLSLDMLPKKTEQDVCDPIDPPCRFDSSTNTIHCGVSKK